MNLRVSIQIRCVSPNSELLFISCFLAQHQNRAKIIQSSVERTNKKHARTGLKSESRNHKSHSYGHPFPSSWEIENKNFLNFRSRFTYGKYLLVGWHGCSTNNELTRCVSANCLRDISDSQWCHSWESSEWSIREIKSTWNCTLHISTTLLMEFEWIWRNIILWRFLL